MPVTTSLHERFRGVGRELLDLLSLYDSLSVSGAEWIPVEGSFPVSAAGADSSRQVEVYRGVILYAVQGYAILVSRNGLSDRVEDASVGYIEISEASKVGVKVARDSLVSSTAKTLEVSLLHRLAGGGGVDLLLFDGSYESFLGPILVFKGELRKASPKLAERIRGLWEHRLRVLDELYRRARLIFISKSSGKLNLVKRGGVKAVLGDREYQVPDFIVVRRILSSMRPPKPGFLWYENPYMELKRGECDEVKRVAPSLSCWYTLTYVLLHPAGKAYQLTTPGRLSREEVEELVKQLMHVSPDGYPYLLSVAHHSSRLTRSDFKSLVALLTPELETGREQLEQTLAIHGEKPSTFKTSTKPRI
jgi:hypothetical protein